MRVTIDLPENLGNEIQNLANSTGKSFKDFIIESLQATTQEQHEDELLVKFAEKCESEGFASIEESEKFMENFLKDEKNA